MTIKTDGVEFLQDDDGRPYIRVIDGDYAGVCVHLGSVSFNGTDESPIMSYTYDITEGLETIRDKVEFERCLGDFIVEQIQQRLEKHDLVYTGGV